MLNLVTGGAGFIGSRLVNALVDAGQQAIIIDDMSTGRIRNLEYAVQSGRATLIYADADIAFDSLNELVARATNDPIDRIFHLAPASHPKGHDATPWEGRAGEPSDSLGTSSLIELALAHSARFLFASRPDARETTAEGAVAAAVSERRLQGRIVRPFDCYGPAMNEAGESLVAELFRAAFEGRPFPIHGSESQTRSPLFVGDAVALIRLVMERPQATLQAVDVASPEEYSVRQIAGAIARVAGVEFDTEVAPERETEARPYAPDLAAARGYGWQPKTSLEQGLRATHRWLSEGRLAFA